MPGTQPTGLYVGLGIGDYSDESTRYVTAFAEERKLRLRTVDLRDEYGYDIPTAARATKRGAVFGMWNFEAPSVR